MKYLLRFNEALEELDLESIESNEFAGLNREELLALLDAAERDADWAEVKAITQALKKTGAPTPRHLARPGDWAPLAESVAQAKSILNDLARGEIARREGEIEASLANLDPSEHEAARLDAEREIQDSFLRHPDFIEIRDNIAKRNPGWMGTLVKFRFLQGAEMSTIEQLVRLMNDYRDQLDQLPKTPEQYADLKPKRGEAPGWEQLGDEFSRLAEVRKGNWIVKALPKLAVSTPAHAAAGFKPINLKEAYREATREKQLELLRAAAALAELNKPNLIKSVTQNLSGQPSLDSVIDFIKLQVKNANTDRGKIAERAYAAYPAVAVLYDGPDHMVFSFRNDSQLPFLCAGARGWCIQPAWYNTGYADRFWSYAAGSLQLGILDFSVGADSPFHTVGVTIRPDRSVYSLCDQPNRCQSGNDYRTMFKSFSTASGSHKYPQELIDAVNLVFEQEVKLKTKTDNFYKEVKKYSEGERDYAKAVQKTLLGMIRNLNDLAKKVSLSKDDMETGSGDNIAKQIVASEIQSLKGSPEMEQVRDDYANNAKQGLASPSDVKIFEIVMEDSPKLSTELLNAVIGRNDMILNALRKNLAAAPPGARESEGFKRIQMLQTGVEEAKIQLEALREKIKK
jgi:hypothetical protein